MNIETINSELKKVLRITERWSDGPIANIERAAVLSRLQSVYDTILLDDQEYDDDQAEVHSQPEMEHATTPGVMPVAEPVAVSAYEPVAEEPAVADTTIEVSTPEMLIEEPDFEIADDFDIQPEVQEPEIQGLEIQEVEIPQTVAPTKPQRKELIKSLYGDDAFGAVSTPRNDRQAEFEESIRTETMHVIGPVVTKPVAEVIVSELPFFATEHTVSDNEPKQVLSDMYAMQQEHNTVGDAIGRSIHTTDLASKIVLENSDGLRRSIGINDKFLLIRDVFDNDANAYERGMSQFESFSDLNDALIYMYDNINANPNSDGMKLLIELLTRKLS